MSGVDDYLIVRKSLLAELIDEAQASVDDYHQGMAGYRPQRHAELDDLMARARLELAGETLSWADDIERLQEDVQATLLTNASLQQRVSDLELALRRQKDAEQEILELAPPDLGTFIDYVWKVKCENEALRHGMKGDYDLDAWLGYYAEKTCLLAKIEDLQIAAEQLRTVLAQYEGMTSQLGDMSILISTLYSRRAAIVDPSLKKLLEDHVAAYQVSELLP